MSDSILLKIHEELVAIRELLAKQQTAAPAKTYSGGSTPEGPPPQPTTLFDDPGSEVVFFGKNNGKRLDELSERSLGFYASVKEPRLDNSGKPFPPRPADVKLENAARQLWHQKKGSLGGGTAQTRIERKVDENANSGRGAGDPDVPFKSLHLDHG